MRVPFAARWPGHIGARRQLGPAGGDHGPDADVRAPRRCRAAERSRPRRPRRLAAPRRRARRALAARELPLLRRRTARGGARRAVEAVVRARAGARRRGGAVEPSRPTPSEGPAQRRPRPRVSTISMPTSPRRPTSPPSTPTWSSGCRRSPPPPGASSATTPPEPRARASARRASSTRRAHSRSSSRSLRPRRDRRRGHDRARPGTRRRLARRRARDHFRRRTVLTDRRRASGRTGRLDAYRQWDRWPYQRIGVRAYMRSTYDRTGGNHTADASHFLYQEADDFNVTLDVDGPGRPLLRALQPLARQPVALRGGRRGSHRPGDQHRRSEEPESRVRLPARAAFPPPLTWTWSTTKGADLIVGADPVRAVVPHGLLAHVLRHRLLHLPPVRRRHAAVASDRELGRRDPAVERRARADRARRAATSRRRREAPA